MGVSAHAHLPFGESHALIDVAMGRFTNAASSKESKSLDVAYGMSGAGKIRYRTFIVQEYCEHGEWHTMDCLSTGRVKRAAWQDWHSGSCVEVTSCVSVGGALQAISSLHCVDQSSTGRMGATW